MDGVQRGEIKKLLVLELLPKQVNFSGGPDLVSWLGTFSLERVLGTVPVEEDGSACFEVPACRPVFFVALDEHDMSVQRMHSFVSVMPGETTSCVGCHEPRLAEPAVARRSRCCRHCSARPARSSRSRACPDVVDFPRDIQPILDRHCVACHNYQRRDGGVLLTGDLGAQWSHSFFHLFAHLQVGDGRNGLGNYPPRSIGSAASPLLQKLDKSHYDVQVTPGRMAHRVAVDRKRCAVCRQLRRLAQRRRSGDRHAGRRRACSLKTPSSSSSGAASAMRLASCRTRRAARSPSIPSDAGNAARTQSAHRYAGSAWCWRTIRRRSSARPSW